MSSWTRAARHAALLLFTVSGCSSSQSSNGGLASPSGAFGDGGGGNGPVGSNPGFPGGEDAALVLPPEIKSESNYQSPVATGQIVWTANPTSGRVAYIDAKTFSVQTVQAGDGPTYLAAVPDTTKTHDVAIVLNVRSQDATLLSRDRQSGKLSTKIFPSTADANSWAVSQKTGRWAIAWTNATRIPNADPIRGFHDLAVLDLGGPQPATILAVGYRPSQVVFSQDEARAFAVTEDGISVIDLRAQPIVTQNLALSPAAAADASAPDVSAVDASAPEGSANDASPETAAPEASTSHTAGGLPSGRPDVSFAADGSYALVRQDGVAAITVISLKDGAATRVMLPAAPTDLAMAPDGTFAVAVLRDTSTVAVLPLPGIATDPTSFTTTSITGETVGRAIVAQNPASKQTSVLLFTTAAAIDRLTVLTLGPAPTFRTVTLHAPVLAVFPTDDAQNAVVLHSVVATPGSNVKGAFSLVPIARELPAKIVALPAPPTAVALATTSDRALVMLRDDATSTYGVDLAMMPSLEVRPYSLASPPIAVGIAAAANIGYVAQDYADGRVTFIDLDAGAARTITGFELGARIVQGSKP
jgi:hypothetical protein